MRRILLVISHLAPEGPVHALSGIVQGFRELGGIDISVLTLSAPAKDGLASVFAASGARVYNVPIDVTNPIRGLAKARRFIKDGGFDAVMSTCIRADIVLALTKLTTRGLNCFSTVQNVPGEDLPYLFPGWKGKVSAWLHYRTLKVLAPNVIAVSETVRTNLKQIADVDSTVIWNPVALGELSGVPPHEQHKGTQALPLPNRVVMASSLTSRKNPEEAVDFILRHPALHQAELHVFGEGPLKEAMAQRTASAFPGRIHWRGFTDRLPQELARADLYVSASRSEGLPLTPQIALICGCPCVLSDIPQHRELGAASPHVYLYTPGSQASFDKAVDSALSIPRATIAAAGLQLARHVAPVSVARKLNVHFQQTT